MSPSATLEAAQAGTRPPDAPASPQWIISKSDDITWFIGSASISYLALGLAAVGFPLLPLVLIWLLGVDGPHIMATVTRTYFDKQERAKLGSLLWLPIPLLCVGPLMVAAGYESLFFLFAVCWQHFHIVKQHFGFVMLYKAKNRERDRRDFVLDRWFLLASLFLPLTVFVFRTRPFLSARIPMEWIATVGGVGYALLAGAWLWRQAEKYRARAPMNWPKLALLAVVVPLQWLAFFQAGNRGADGILLAGISLGLFHSFQYHRLMWFHNKNRYQQPGAKERHGLAVRLAANALAYFGAAAALYFVLMYLPPLVYQATAVTAAMWGFSFAHYIIDGKIWHVRSDRELAAALRIA